jgi:hypothetical protein
MAGVVSCREEGHTSGRKHLVSLLLRVPSRKAYALRDCGDAGTCE